MLVAIFSPSKMQFVDLLIENEVILNLIINFERAEIQPHYTYAGRPQNRTNKIDHDQSHQNEQLNSSKWKIDDQNDD